MRIVYTLFGAVLIGGYAVVGAFLMNGWVVAAASGVSLDQAITAMSEADQPYSIFGGLVFAALGVLLALGWALLALLPRVGLPVWASLALWAGILALGAPAYFFLSFGNMNSVGDTFSGWNAAAAFALEKPLYLISGAALLLCLGALAAPLLRHETRRASAATA